MTLTLQPPNATPLETALSETGAALAAIPVPLATVWNPDTCPAHMLGWLAWALSVDVWEPDWTEAQKREACRQSYAVHSRKGTIGAVRAALQAVDYDVDIVEWYDQDPPAAPYTFEASVEISGRGIDDATQGQIERLIDASKNVRSHMTALRLVGSVRGSIHIAGCATVSETVTLYPLQITDIEVSGSCRLGLGVAVYETVLLLPYSEGQ